MIITKTKTTTYEIKHIVCDFSSYERFRETREKYGLTVQKTCFRCNEKFKDGDMMHLAFMVKSKNRLICGKCKAEAISEGVPFSGEEEK